MSMSIQRSPEIEYAPKASSHGSYRMSRVLPLGNTTATLAASSTTEIQFEIPNKVYNLSKSSLDFELRAAESATTSAINRIHTNGLVMFDRIHPSQPPRPSPQTSISHFIWGDWHPLCPFIFLHVFETSCSTRNTFCLCPDFN